MNRKLINEMNALAESHRIENIEQAAQKDTEQIYAGIALALYDLLDYPPEQRTNAITTIFAKSQEYWISAVKKKKDIRQECINVTGIDVRCTQD